ncbi:hypothetical protein [Capnocytophaga sp. oral taxon 323]|uniref:hypothetical protein n=1 Tax=Capnocytophaga sp. oral taxon 323 TaxID=1705617 RepID=UPI0012FA554D|nr:hypothetical protein [Capnocytophaga sp. oral taxon 323]
MYSYIHRTYTEHIVALQWLYSGSTVALHRTIIGIKLNSRRMHLLLHLISYSFAPLIDKLTYWLIDKLCLSLHFT